MKICASIEFEWCSHKLRLVPHLGPIVEQASKTPSVRPTPPFHESDLMAAFTMTDSQQTTCTISAVDKKNNPVTLPTGTVAWAVDSPTVLTLTPAADGMSCVVAAATALGDAKVSVTVADPATGNTIAAGTLDVTVTAGNATSITITPGAPTEQP